MRENDISIEEGGLTIRKVVVTFDKCTLYKNSKFLSQKTSFPNSSTRQSFKHNFRSKKRFQGLSKLSASDVLNGMVQWLVLKCTPGRKWQRKVYFGARCSIWILYHCHCQSSWTQHFCHVHDSYYFKTTKSFSSWVNVFVFVTCLWHIYFVLLQVHCRPMGHADSEPFPSEETVHQFFKEVCPTL